MENLIARVATAADISPDVARKAVALIGDFIQREAPEEAVKELFEKAPAFPSIIASSTQTGGEGMGGGLKGLMGVAGGAMGGGGLMALGSELLSLGLDMEQIQTIGKEVFAYRARSRGRSGRGRNLRRDSRAFPVHLAEVGVGRGREPFSRLHPSRLAQSRRSRAQRREPRNARVQDRGWRSDRTRLSAGGRPEGDSTRRALADHRATRSSRRR